MPKTQEVRTLEKCRFDSWLFSSHNRITLWRPNACHFQNSNVAYQLTWDSCEWLWKPNTVKTFCFAHSIVTKLNAYMAMSISANLPSEKCNLFYSFPKTSFKWPNKANQNRHSRYFLRSVILPLEALWPFFCAPILSVVSLSLFGERSHSRNCALTTHNKHQKGTRNLVPVCI